MKSRLWYPQLDISSCARRFLQILMHWNDEPLNTEKLFIFDFYLASPSLIGDIKMDSANRAFYGKQHLPKKKDEFVNFPPAALLFHSMLPIQQKAQASLAAKNILDKEFFEIGNNKLTEFGNGVGSTLQASSKIEGEAEALDVLIRLFSSELFEGSANLRSRTGLRYYD